MKLKLENISYSYDDLSPVMSKETLEYHRDNLAAGYVKRFNQGKGDSKFNEAGAFLHNIFFPQLQPSSEKNNPFGNCLDFIKENYKTFSNFKKEFQKVAMSIQGSGWLYLSNKGEIKTIKNHEIKKDILLLVDWWEHAWSLDYQSDKKSYLDNIWKIINWSVINDRIITKESKMIKNLIKIANELDQKKLFKDADKVDEIITKESGKSFAEGNVSQIDIRTLKYIRDNYDFTDEAKKVFDKKLNDLIG